jgi:hypothetical protein
VVTSDLNEVMEGVDTVMICTQALAHDRAARELAPLIKSSDLIILNPGSSGRSLLFAQIFRELAFDDLPTIIETSTLTYGCCAKGYKVEVHVKVNRVSYPSTLSYLELRKDSRNGILKAISYHSLKEIRRRTI